MIKLRPYAAAICDKFEQLLDEHGIDIPDNDRTGEEGEAHLYGTTYVTLEDDITDILEKLTFDVVKHVEITVDKYVYEENISKESESKEEE